MPYRSLLAIFLQLRIRRHSSGDKNPTNGGASVINPYINQVLLASVEIGSKACFLGRKKLNNKVISLFDLAKMTVAGKTPLHEANKDNSRLLGSSWRNSAH
ncbi:hypothetical protein AMATHDRAFT_4901 [Amanita thiersii Skay4041]|uniref:Uncharacterized protein n=1 Tax=Amanita thiersii Skay4041 TaxID=703135 RepID=A0A2A9NHB5_9AGAR|nr:hypothetical protein AMATHDRAFT_4901 [Amanita thiersii Skay4041]